MQYYNQYFIMNFYLQLTLSRIQILVYYLILPLQHINKDGNVIFFFLIPQLKHEVLCIKFWNYHKVFNP